MKHQDLNITLLQPDIVWEDKTANLSHVQNMLKSENLAGRVVVLPEMFSTGFSMTPEKHAESMEGPSIAWMAETAVRHRCILTGSLMIVDDGAYYNRLLWVQPDGTIGHYDKRHLFAFAGEHEHYTAGNGRLIASVNGWRVNLMVCYDLRFPVWARNQNCEYDVLIYVANWPQQRSLAWKTLLQARAIENQCYVVGVNRVGSDAKGNVYSGDSSVFGPLGEQMAQEQNQEAIRHLTLSREHLDTTRLKFPFLQDGDQFLLL